MQVHGHRVGTEGLDVRLGQPHDPFVRLGPPAFLIAATTSPAVTEPNSFPESPAVFTGSVTGPSASIAVLSSLAWSRSRTALVSRARRMSSACFCAPREATIAKPRGSRKLRP